MANGSINHSNNLLELFCRNMVALCLTYQNIADNGPSGAIRFFNCPGTLIEIRGLVFFLTAGHTLREVRTSINNGEIYLDNVVLADIFGQERISSQPIPFDLSSARMAFIDHSNEGLDFGIIYLREYYVNLLRANRVRILREENWNRQHTIEYNAFLMLGLPDEFSSEELSQIGDVGMVPTMFRVTRIERPPDDIYQTNSPRFVGQLDENLPLENLTGMSGGPIFGIRFSEEIRYWVVAIQSSWLPNQRIVFGCPMPIICGLLTSFIDEIAENQST